MKMSKKHPYKRIISVISITFVLLIGAAGLVYSLFSQPVDNSQSTEDTSRNPSTAQTAVKIKNLGINLDYYDPVTNRAGDIEFTMFQFDNGLNKIFIEYGEEIPGNSTNNGIAKINPQPTFLAPLGTKVYALVDGVVFDVPKLYSNDYGVMVQAEGSELIFETEHVIKPVVKKGDKVKAGDVVAEVSDYNGDKLGGLGLVEIGVLKPSSNSAPAHLCPFDYLDDSIKDQTLNKISQLKKSWENYRGDTSMYDESKEIIPGCLTRDPIEG